MIKDSTFQDGAETDPEGLALRALAHIVGDPEALSRFLDATGLDPQTVRRAAADPGFLPGVLDHLLADEALLVAFARSAGIDPAAVPEARRRLGGAAP